jgi:hypothetical protein
MVPWCTAAPVPVTIEHDGVLVVRDDLLPGGTKARFLGTLFEGVGKVVYASPAEDGAPQLGKQATIFVARRASPHARTMEAAQIGA